MWKIKISIALNSHRCEQRNYRWHKQMGYGCDGIRAYSALLTQTAFNKMLVGTACCLFMTIVGMAVSIGMMIDLKAYLLAMMMVRYHRCCQQGEHRKHPEYYGQYTTQFFIIVFEHRGTEGQSFFVLTQRHKGMKIYSGYKDNKHCFFVSLC